MYPINQNRDLRVIDRDNHFGFPTAAVAAASEADSDVVHVRYRDVVNETRGALHVRDTIAMVDGHRVSVGVLMRGLGDTDDGPEVYAVSAAGLSTSERIMPLVSVARVPGVNAVAWNADGVNLIEDRIIAAGKAGRAFCDLNAHEVVSLSRGPNETGSVTFGFILSFQANNGTLQSPESGMVTGNLSVQRLTGPWKQGSRVE